VSREISEKSRKFDLFVAPEQLRNYKILDPDKADELFDLGYQATKEKMKEINIDSFVT
jgi:predicted acylesterase/phospholipase RssA